MVDLSKCIFATPGEFEEEGGNPGPGGGTGPTVGPPGATDAEAGPPRVDFPDDGGGKPPGNPTIPVIFGPTEIFIPVEDPPYTTSIVIPCDPIEIPRTDTTTTLSGIGLKLAGPLMDAAANWEGGDGGPTPTLGPQDFVDQFTATLIFDDIITSERPRDHKGNLVITVPNDANAMAFYAANEGLLDAINVEGGLSVNFTAEFPSGDEINWITYDLNFNIPITLQIAIQEAQPPNIDYGENELNIWYNTPEEINQIGEVLPLFDGWDLGDYEIIPGTVDFGIAPAIDNNYPADENFSLDEVTGKITSQSTSWANEQEIPLDGRRVTLTFRCSPKPGFSGEDNLLVGDLINLNFLDYDEENTPTYGNNTVTVFFNDVDGSLEFILEPQVWPTGSFASLIDVNNNGQTGPAAPGTDGAQFYDWNGIGGGGVSYVTNGTDGRIKFSSISTSFQTAPTNVAIVIEKPGSPGKEEIIPISLQNAQALFTTTGPNSLSRITNPSLGISINIPNEYTGIQGSKNNLFRASTSTTTVLKRKAFYTGRARPLNPQDEAKKKEFTSYTDGITSNSFSYIKGTTVTDGVSLPATSKIGGPFSDVVDETVRGLVRGNKGEDDVANYYYNSITGKKVIDSLDPKIRRLLESSLASNGQPLSVFLGSFLLDSLVRNEQEFFSKEDLLSVKSWGLNTTPISRTEDASQDRSTAMDLVLNQALSINPNAYNIKAKNRLLNWKSLAEDLNKRLVYKTADSVEYDIFIPNNEVVTVVTSDGTAHNLEMQDGDYFNAKTVDGDDRLTVFSDVDIAKVLPARESSQAAFLAKDRYQHVLDVTSVTTDLVEFNVDTTGPRLDYYFLSLDKNTIEDVPGDFNDGDTLFTRKTKAVYNYTTTGIDDIVKHRAFPYMFIYLRHDDMFFNHLENSEKVTLTHKDITLDNFTNTPSDLILARQLPQHILIIPSDRTENVISHNRSVLADFNKRRLYLSVSPALQSDPQNKPPYLKSELTTEDSINFDTDVVNGVVYTEDIKYVFDTAAVNAIKRYKTDSEPLPRKEMPTTKALSKINEIKTTYSLTSRESIGVYDLYSRLHPYEFTALGLDQDTSLNFRSRLMRNSITEDKTINETYFVPVREISNINNATPTLLPENPDSPVVSARKTEALDDVGGGIPAPEVRIPSGAVRRST